MQTPTRTSPYELLQERFCHDPWKLLVVCMMLNQTSAKQVKQVVDKFFLAFPAAESLVQADVRAVAEFIRPLGLYNRRAAALQRMSIDYLREGWTDVQDFYGVGKYASDSYRIFVLRECPENEEDVDDKELKNYVRWARGAAPN